MPQSCAVPFCLERKGGHKFPCDKEREKLWVQAIRRDNFTPSLYARVCKKHFRTEDYTFPKESVVKNPKPVLKKDAVPSIFSWSKTGVPQGKQKRNQKVYKDKIFNTNKRKDSMKKNRSPLGHKETIEVPVHQKNVKVDASAAFDIDSDPKEDIQCCPDIIIDVKL